MAALQNLLYLWPILKIVVQQILEYFLHKVKKKQIHISDIKKADVILPLPVSWVMFLLCTTGGERMTDRAAEVFLSATDPSRYCYLFKLRL